MPDLRALRKQLGLTQAELAAALGVSRKTISERETGKVSVSRETELAMQALMTGASDRGPDDLDRPSRP